MKLYSFILLLLQFNEIFSFAVIPVRLKTSMKLLGKVWNLTRLRTKITNSPKDYLHPLVLIHQRLPGKHPKKLNLFFARENIKNGPQKFLIIGPKLFFHSTGPAAQTSPEFIFHIIKNVPRLMSPYLWLCCVA